MHNDRTLDRPFPANSKLLVRAEPRYRKPTLETCGTNSIRSKGEYLAPAITLSAQKLQHVTNNARLYDLNSCDLKKFLECPDQEQFSR